MFVKIIDYFDNVIMPIIHREHPHVYADMSIMILGSVGLGIDDEFSDMEAAIYLDDASWHKHGAWLQLSLNKCLADTNPWQKKGSIISVYPVSWLLDGQANNIFSRRGNFFWEKVSIESLFTMQENLIYSDPHGILKSLREETVAQRCPEYVWKKSLLTIFKQLVL